MFRIRSICLISKNISFIVSFFLVWFFDLRDAITHEQHKNLYMKYIMVWFFSFISALNVIFFSFCNREYTYWFWLTGWEVIWNLFSVLFYRTDRRFMLHNSVRYNLIHLEYVVVFAVILNVLFWCFYYCIS